MTSILIDNDSSVLKHSFSDEISYSIFANFDGEDDDWNIIDIHHEEESSTCDGAVVNSAVIQDVNSWSLNESAVDAAMEQYKGTSACDMIVMTDDELNQQLEGFQTCFNHIIFKSSSVQTSSIVDANDEDCFEERNSEYQHIEPPEAFDHEQCTRSERKSITSESVTFEHVSQDTSKLEDVQSPAQQADTADCDEFGMVRINDETTMKNDGITQSAASGDSTHEPPSSSLSSLLVADDGLASSGFVSVETPLPPLCSDEADYDEMERPSIVDSSESEEEEEVAEEKRRSNMEIPGDPQDRERQVDELGPLQTDAAVDTSLVAVAVAVNEVPEATSSSSSSTCTPLPSSSAVSSSTKSSPPPAERRAMISFLDFRSGDIALFLPMDAQTRDVWSAFNSMKQHHYLSEQSMAVFLPRGAGKDQRVFVLGRIIMIDTHRACANFNPYRLPLDTLFHVCHVEPLNKCRQRASTSFSTSGLINNSTSDDSSSSSVVSADSAELPRVGEPFPRISFMEFNSGELALFMLGNKQRNIWMAFHSNRPYHFLSDDSLAIFMDMKRDQQRMFILGRLIYVDTQTATLETNPYALPQGTQFHVCYVEPVSARGLLAQQQR